MQRRALLALIPPAGLAVAGCGFKLRGSQNYGIERIAVLPNPGGPLLTELRRAAALRHLTPIQDLGDWGGGGRRMWESYRGGRDDG